MIRRRITLQLTPLLDMLLVVLFAQYLQLQAAAHQRVDAVSRSAVERIAAAEKDRSDAEVARSQTAEELAQKEALLREARGEVAALRERIREIEQTSQEQQRQYQADLKRIGEIAADLLDINAGLFEEAMRGVPPKDARLLMEGLADLKGKPPEAVVRHLREVDEIKKRCDLWQVHVGEDGKTLFKMPHMADAAGLWVADANDLVLKVRPMIANAPEPKSLVLVLYSYADATWGARRPVEGGLEELKDWLRAEYGGAKTFHVAPMGYTISPP